MIITEEKKQEFAMLFQEFINSYLLTPNGLRHLSAYNEQRKQGKINFETVINALKNKEDITDLVLLKLLPYTNTEENKKRGAWIHIAPALSTDVRIQFGRTKPIDWNLIAEEIFRFINKCYNRPQLLVENCQDFLEVSYTKSFNIGILSPILNALHPDKFLLVDSTSRRLINYCCDNLINYFTGHISPSYNGNYSKKFKKYSLKLTNYAIINYTGFQLIESLKNILKESYLNLADLKIEDNFYIFCFWLVKIKKFTFSELSTGMFCNIIDDLNEKYYFSDNTFALLEKLHQNQTQEFYLNYKEEFKLYVEIPFKTLFNYMASQLPLEITNLMEIETQFFSPILNNIHTETFMWGAFYPNNGKSTEDAHLFLFLNKESCEFGFYIGKDGNDKRTKFINFCQNNQDYIIKLMNDIYAIDNNIYLGNRDNYYINENQEVISKKNVTLESWLNNITEEDLHLVVILPYEKVLNYSQTELSDYILNIYQNLFPLVLITIYDDPIPKIDQYLESLDNCTNLKEINLEEIEPEIKTINPEYTLENLYQDTYLKEDKINPILKAIERKKQIILQGSPGTGKTFLAQHLAKYLISNNDGFYELVQFHPSYSYEDFIQGIRPISNNGTLEYKMIKGRFLEFCEKAKQSEGKCVLIIDEINRGNLASIFGELMYLLEYREQNIKLSGSNDDFSIPKNVVIIGTMNTADRSIALVDHALRRRFSFITLKPNYDILKTYHQQQTKLKIDDLIKVLKELNKTINDPHYQLGISFFLTKELKENIEDIWMMEIEPYLEEYFFDNLDKVKDFSWQNIKDRIKF